MRHSTGRGSQLTTRLETSLSKWAGEARSLTLLLWRKLETLFDVVFSVARRQAPPKINSGQIILLIILRGSGSWPGGVQRQRPPAVSPWRQRPPILVRKHDVAPHSALDGEGTWIMYRVHELPSK
jgi:hypothetical protein